MECMKLLYYNEFLLNIESLTYLHFAKYTEFIYRGIDVLH